MNEMFIDNPKYKEVPGFGGKYYASVNGDIISVSSRTIKVLVASKKENGYLSVGLSKGNVSKTFYVHRIIAETFLEKEDGKDFVNHKNSKRHDNRLSNLEWVTHEDNMDHVHSWKKHIGNDLFVSYSKNTDKYCLYLLHSTYDSLDDALNEKRRIESIKI
jgi:hypothetical protein